MAGRGGGPRSSMPMADATRRTFRGRAGPTDRNLNKHQARRRKQTAAVSNDPEIIVSDEIMADTTKDNRTTATATTAIGQSVDCEERITDADIEIIILPTESLALYESTIEETLGEQSLDTDPATNCLLNEGIEDKRNDEGSSPNKAMAKELKHLQKRIRNIRESIQLSEASLSDPTNWNNNSLNAVSNCVNEWRSIVSFHSSEDDAFDSYELTRETALDVYQLVQMAMQTGPLKGSNAGYFKRCGSAVARMAVTFLHSILSGDATTQLKFSKKQVEAISNWLSNAEKAVAANKPPSKSSAKLQQQQAAASSRKTPKQSSKKKPK
eukprot:scaffold69010_cov56-Attheya_sp.AAC.1